jgi:hypothetical protein
MKRIRRTKGTAPEQKTPTLTDNIRAMMDATNAGLVTLRPPRLLGATEPSIIKQTGHRSVQMVRRYTRDGSLFRENSAGKLGL